MSKLLNQTSISTKVLKSLVEFVSIGCTHSFMTRFKFVVRETDLPIGIAGLAEREDGTPAVEPSLVTITVPKHTTSYPVRSRHDFVSEVGWVGFRSQEEELVFVLAHELRHIDQMWGTPLEKLPDPSFDIYFAELDAELFALRTLYRFQQVAPRVAV